MRESGQVTRDISFCVAHLSTSSLSRCRVFGIPVTSSYRNDNCASQAWICRLRSISWGLLHRTHWLVWVYRGKDSQERYLEISRWLDTHLACASGARYRYSNYGQSVRAILSHNVVWFWPVTSSHTLGINKLWTPHEDRHDDEASQSFWKAVNHVFEVDVLYWLLKKLLLYPEGGLDGWEWALLCIKPPSSHPPMLVLIYVPEDCVSQVLWCCNITKRTHP